MSKNKKIKITLKRSKYGKIKKHIDTLNALGLRKINQYVIKDDTPQVRGMIKSVEYLIEVEEL